MFSLKDTPSLEGHSPTNSVEPGKDTDGTDAQKFRTQSCTERCWTRSYTIGRFADRERKLENGVKKLSIPLTEPFRPRQEFFFSFGVTTLSAINISTRDDRDGGVSLRVDIDFPLRNVCLPFRLLLDLGRCRAAAFVEGSARSELFHKQSVLRSLLFPVSPLARHRYLRRKHLL